VIVAGGLAAAVAILSIPRPPPLEPLSAAATHATIMAAAVSQILDAPTAPAAPIVLGVGELHQTADTAGIPSSLARFTREIWPLIAAHTSDLIVETWVTDGACGSAEASTVDQVETITQRPAATEDQILTLLRRAEASGVRPHILKVDCTDYRLLSPAPRDARGAGSGTSAGAPLDFQRMLALIQRKLAAKLTEVLAGRRPSEAAKLVVVYGGALHNDLYPDPLLASFSYGVPAFRATLGRYRELDLYVPEYLERNPALHAEPWFAWWQRAARPGAIVIIRRSPAWFILIFPRS
jgi:hypothetical protein